MKTYTVEQYYDLLRTQTNEWLASVSGIIRSITKEVMDQRIESTTHDGGSFTLHISVPCIDYSISIRGRGYAFRNSRAYMIKYRGINTLYIKINNNERYCSVENCYYSKSMYTNGIIRDIDYIRVTSHLLAVIDELQEDYPDVTIITQQQRTYISELAANISNLFNKTVKV